MARHKSPKRVIDLLVDIVSRNGNLILNYALDGRQQRRHLRDPTVEDLRQRPGSLRAALRPLRPVQRSGPQRLHFTADEVRFTTKGSTLYAFVMGWPEKQAVIEPLATTSSVAQMKVKNVKLLGFKGKVKWTQDETGLTVQMPEQKPCDRAITLRIVYGWASKSKRVLVRARRRLQWAARWLTISLRRR